MNCGKWLWGHCIALNTRRQIQRQYLNINIVELLGVAWSENLWKHSLCSRLFLVHEDGSGTELLSSQTVEELLYQAYSDPTVALLKEPLPDTQGSPFNIKKIIKHYTNRDISNWNITWSCVSVSDDFGITILKPSHRSVWSQWLLEKQKPDFTPPNLRDRSWHDFPRTEVHVTFMVLLASSLRAKHWNVLFFLSLFQTKTPGPPFGVDMGRGLTLRERSAGSAAQCQPVRSCPKVLEMRELYQHRLFTTPLRNKVDTQLKVKQSDL